MRRDADARRRMACAERKPGRAGGCFVAGTLVHAREGLVPIEKLKVGDWVLSKPESGDGAQAYKRVVNTFRFEDKEVFFTRFAGDFKGSLVESFLVATGNHPFWVDGIGWTRADLLDDASGHEVVLANGGTMIANSEELFVTGIEDIAWACRADGRSDLGSLVDFRRGASEYDFYLKNTRLADLKARLSPHNYDFEPGKKGYNLGTYPGGLDWMEPGAELRRTVYDIEVEEDHTYYVGEVGIWVRDGS